MKHSKEVQTPASRLSQSSRAVRAAHSNGPTQPDTTCAFAPGPQLKAYGYVRAGATGRAVNRLESGIERQKDSIRDFALNHNLNLARVIEKAGVAADDSHALDQVLEAARLGKFRVLIVARQSRLGRNIATTKAVVHELEDLGVEIYEATGRRITMEGKAATMTLLQAMVDELELVTIRECAACGRGEGNALSGYVATHVTRPHLQTLLKSAREGRLIRTISRRVANGESPTGVAADLSTAPTTAFHPTKATLVRETFRRVGEREPIAAIAADLRVRGRL